jgi:hypothetical protein
VPLQRTLTQDLHNDLLNTQGTPATAGYTGTGTAATSMTNEWKVYKVTVAQNLVIKGCATYVTGGYLPYAYRVAVWEDNGANYPGNLWNDFGADQGGWYYRYLTTNMPKILRAGTYWFGGNTPGSGYTYINNDGDTSGEVYGLYYPFSNPAPDPFLDNYWIHGFYFHLCISLYGVVQTDRVDRTRIVPRSCTQGMRSSQQYIIGCNKSGASDYVPESGGSDQLLGYETGSIEHTNPGEWKCTRVIVAESMIVSSMTCLAKLYYSLGQVGLAVWKDDGSGMKPYRLWNDFGKVNILSYLPAEYSSTVNMPKLMLAGTYWLGSSTQPGYHGDSLTITYYDLDPACLECGGYSAWGPAPDPYPTPWFVAYGAHLYIYLTAKYIHGVRGYQYLAPDTGSITQYPMLFYSHVACHVRLAIYNDSGDYPNQLLWETDSFSVSAGWNSLTVLNGYFRNDWFGLVVKEQKYWLTYQCDFTGSTALGPSLNVGVSNRGIFFFQAYDVFPASLEGGSLNARKWSQYTTESTLMFLVPTLTQNIVNTVSIPIKTFFKTLTATISNLVHCTPWNFFYQYPTQDLSNTATVNLAFLYFRTVTQALENSSVLSPVYRAVRSVSASTLLGSSLTFFKGAMKTLSATIINVAEQKLQQALKRQAAAALSNAANPMGLIEPLPPFTITLEEHK